MANHVPATLILQSKIFTLRRTLILPFLYLFSNLFNQEKPTPDNLEKGVGFKFET